MKQMKAPDKELATKKLVDALWAEKHLKERIREDTALLAQLEIQLKVAISDFIYAHTWTKA